MHIDMMLNDFDSRTQRENKMQLNRRQKIVLQTLEKIGPSSKVEILNFCDKSMSKQELSCALNRLKDIDFVKSATDLDPQHVDMRKVKYENNVAKKQIYVPLL